MLYTNGEVLGVRSGRNEKEEVFLLNGYLPKVISHALQTIAVHPQKPDAPTMFHLGDLRK